MKRIILFTIMMLMSLMLFSQTVYSWTPGVNPGWTNAGALQWRPGCLVVTTNCTGNYANNLNTTYTSPVLNTTCTNASTVVVSFYISGEAENGWDILFLEYSIDGGSIWINPYGVGVGLSGNAGAGLTWVLPAIPASNNFVFRFNFVSDGSLRYSGYKLSNFQIVCNPMLPIELLTFDGFNKKENNILTWSTASENNNDYFTLERSEDGENWKTVDSIDGAGNSTQLLNYTTVDNNFREVINYYRLSQTDYNGTREFFKIIAIDNRTLGKTILKVVNAIGQEVDINASGVIFIIYTNGEIERKFNI